MDRGEKEHERILSELDRRKMKRRMDSDEFKVVEGVIDPPTLKILYKLLNRGVLQAVHGVISAGKEANVYRGEAGDGTPVAVKIYRMSTAETDFMLEYIVGDPRFRRVRRRSRVLIPQWAMKEYKNLQRFYEAGVPVPHPIDIERNVVVMEFIGDKKTVTPAPLLKNVTIPSPVKTFNEIIGFVELAYKSANLVHADLSEYNILWLNQPIIIDVSQSVLTSHDNASKYLYRDIQNLCNFFKKLGVDTEEPKIITNHILASGENK
ncbi:MAG: serine protein kinase RIO [Candidatus Thorarchaeota archaeon]|nr:serine protein kinase RIO [Candidatus Thorarchaeota archaeon]